MSYRGFGSSHLSLAHAVMWTQISASLGPDAPLACPEALQAPTLNHVCDQESAPCQDEAFRVQAGHRHNLMEDILSVNMFGRDGHDRIAVYPLTKFFFSE